MVALKWDNWDDFGFKTSFHAQLQIPGKKLLDLGIVKILRLEQEGGRTSLKERQNALQEDYCSLGQSLAYYEMLRKLGSWYRPYLEAMRDVVFSPIILNTFRSQTGFSNSLLRSSGAEIALDDGPKLFQDGHEVAPSGR
ncbi:hypothetical protein [Granulicella sibirica]|uniref:Uncharacterized protein n=1 Tax=Granulicella sibirica TaxID=2479048 RepID=A0A4Q0SZI1_9BACT|nr:hypothetical protein [Granulicella sibirica]RXH56685.1 hypothetical protein GRAN_3542 [Granulicella sibirica]